MFKNFKNGRIDKALDSALMDIAASVVNRAYPVKKKHRVVLTIDFVAYSKERDHIDLNYTIVIKKPPVQYQGISLAYDEEQKLLIEESKNKDASVGKISVDRSGENIDTQLSFADID